MPSLHIEGKIAVYTRRLATLLERVSDHDGKNIEGYLEVIRQLTVKIEADHCLSVLTLPSDTKAAPDA